MIRAVKKTKIAKATCKYAKILMGVLRPKFNVFIIKFTCLVTTKAKIKYIPKRIRAKVLIKIHVLNPGNILSIYL